MLDSSQNETMRKLANLRASYELGLPARFVTIREDLDKATHATEPDVACGFLTKIRNEAHKLSGSGSIFGFPAISKAAKNLEQACTQFIERQGITSIEYALKEIEAHINVLSRAENIPALEFTEDIAYDDLASRPKSAGRQDKTILLVDDDPELAASLKAQLAVFGFELAWEETPEGLADCLESINPTAVIMDIVFPDNEDAGFVAINALRAEGLIDCPVFFLSQRDDIAARLGAHRAGCSDYLVKPFDIPDLVSSLVEKVFSQDQQPHRVMIVDDDVEVCSHYQALLEGAGLEVFPLTDPMKALQAVHDFSPDGILMDVHMPDCSGIELASVIRQNQNFLHIPIIFLTSDTNQIRKLMVVISGGDDFMNKTAPADYIVATVKTRTQRSRELKHKIEKLGRSENHFRSLAQRVADAIISVDKEGLVIQWNHSAAKIFGYREEEILGLSVMKLFPQDLLGGKIDALFRKETQKINTSYSPAPVEIKALTKNGSRLSVEMSITHWDSEEHWHCTAIIRDVTERKKAEREVRKNNERFRIMTEQSSDWIWESDSEHRITYISEGLSKRVGISRKRFLGQKRSDLAGIDVLKEDLNGHLEILKKHRSFRNFEYGIDSENGGTAYLSINGAPQFAENGDFIGYIGTGTNITQLKLSQVELEEKIDEATRELNAKSQKLEHSLQKEKQVNQMQRQFVSMASHEFRTPLAIIDSTAQRLSNVLEKPGGRKIFDQKVVKIRLAVERLTNLIESTLDAENIDSGKTEFNMRPCNIRSLVLEVCERQQEISDSHTIIANLDALPVQVMADKGKLDQIFTNLLSNAVKYSADADKIKVHGGQDDGNAVISITDYGLGIPKAEQPKIFDRFFRASSSVGIVGTGIGLYLVKEFVALHSGTVDMNSKEGEGTTITVRIPMNLQAGTSLETIGI